MFDINAIIIQALNAAVQDAVAPLVHRVIALEAQSADRHERLRVLEGALTDRVAALENNPAQGVDTTAQARLITADAFVNHLDQQEWFWEKIGNYIARTVVAETDIAGIGQDDFVQLKQRVGALEDKDEKVLTSDDVEAIVERWLDDHCSTYNHDDYDRAVSAIDDVDLEDIITSDNLNDAINEALNGATVSIQV